MSNQKNESGRIFGYTWQQIQDMQQGRHGETLRPRGGMITPCRYEKNEWLRLADDAEKNGRPVTAQEFRDAAAMPHGAEMTLKAFDALQDIYRGWLIGGF